MTFFIELGRLPDLCTYEFKQLAAGLMYEKVADHWIKVEADDEKELIKIANTSGGMVKVLKVIETLNHKDQLVSVLSNLIVQQHIKDFSLFFFPHSNSDALMSEIKIETKKSGMSVRYVRSETHGLSASVLIHQRQVTEFGVFEVDNRFIISQTIWVQNIDHWTLKDRRKPYRDSEKGMLPPKLARMMVNFVSPEIQASRDKKLYDPFCGTGTLLMEALEAQWQVIGSDISQQTIFQCAENMRWFCETQHLPQDYALFAKDASQVTLSDLKTKVDAIVTEPFLGKQQPQEAKLPGMFKGLEKMYWGALKKWATILKNDGEIVLITPLVKTPTMEYSLAKMIDNCPSLGYSIISGPLVYSREQTIVQRAIYHLKFETSSR